MRELITTYLLDRNIDSSRGMRRDWSRKMVNDLCPKEKTATETEKRTLSEDHLFYLLQVDVQEGYQYYTRLFEKAMKGGGSATADYMEGLNQELNPWIGKFSEQQIATWKLNKAIAMQKRETALTFSPQEKAIELLEGLLCEFCLNTIQHASLRYRLVHAYNTIGATRSVPITATGQQGTLPLTIFVGVPGIAENSGAWYHWYEQELNKENLSSDQRRWLLAEFGWFPNVCGRGIPKPVSFARRRIFYTQAKKRYEEVSSSKWRQIKNPSIRWKSPMYRIIWGMSITVSGMV